MKSSEAKKISKEIKDSYKEFFDISLDIYANFKELQKARTQLPLKFLSQKKIKTFIIDLNNRYKADISSQKKKIESLKEKYSQLKSENKEENILKLEKLREEIIILNNSLKHKFPLSLEDETEDHLYFYEDLIKFISNCKHEALKIYEYSLAIYGELEISINEFSSELVLKVSDSEFRALGINKITNDLRTLFLNNNKELNKLKKLSVKIKSVSETSRRLYDAFTSDETNYRRFLERKNNNIGL